MSDEQTAAGVQAADVGETPTNTSIPAPGRHWDRVTEPDAAFQARIRALIGNVPQGDGQPEVENSDEARAQVRAETFRAAWSNSLKTGDVGELAHHRLTDLANDQRPTLLRKFAETMGDPDAGTRTLVIGGGVGPGKTAAAIALGNEASGRGLLARFVTHQSYLKWLRPDGSPADVADWQVRKRHMDADVLVLDDFGAGLDTDKPVTQFVRDETLDLINHRVNTPGRVTIITTNLRSDVRAEDGTVVGGIALMFGDQLISRLSLNGLAVRFDGPDRRGRLSW